MNTKSLQNLVQIDCRDSSQLARAQAFVQRWQLAFRDEQNDAPYTLVFAEDVHLEASKGKSKFSLKVDFCEGENRHRRFHGGGAGQAVAKALGLKKGKRPTVLDLTAGMGSDAFVLACLGSKVSLCERNPIVQVLLADGIARALAHEDDPELNEIAQRLNLIEGDSLHLQNHERFDCVYLDPMFPERKKKSAMVKKDMQAFHDIVGADEDADGLLDLAKRFARQKVVVKRPKGAPDLANEKPSYCLDGKATRFDVYQIA